MGASSAQQFGRAQDPTEARRTCKFRNNWNPCVRRRLHDARVPPSDGPPRAPGGSRDSELPMRLLDEIAQHRERSVLIRQDGTDRIAVSGVKVTLQALVLQMAAAKQFGWDQRFRLDPFTVSLPQPEAVVALLSGRHEVKSHVATVPYNFQELADPRARLLLNSFDVTGGSHSAVVMFGSARWKNQNPTWFWWAAAHCANILAGWPANWAWRRGCTSRASFSSPSTGIAPWICSRSLPIPNKCR